MLRIIWVWFAYGFAGGAAIGGFIVGIAAVIIAGVFLAMKFIELPHDHVAD